MSTDQTISYQEATNEVRAYVQECFDAATDTTHESKKRDAALRADGAIRSWMRLFSYRQLKSGDDAAKIFERDMAALRELAQSIPTT